MTTTHNEPLPKRRIGHDDNRLRVFPCLSEVDDDVVAAVARKSVVKNYRKNEVLFSSSDITKFFFIVEAGAMKIYMDFEGGGMTEVRRVEQGDYFCGVPTCVNKVHTVNAVSVEDTTVIAVPYEDFIDVIHSGLSEFGIRMLTLTCTQTNSLSGFIENIMSKFKTLYCWG